MVSFSIEESHDGPKVTLALSGDLDVSTAAALRTEVSRLLADQPQEIVVDLGDVAFVDVSGLRPLVEAQCRRGSTTMISVHHPNPAVRRILKLTDFDRVLHIEP